MKACLVLLVSLMCGTALCPGQAAVDTPVAPGAAIPSVPVAAPVVGDAWVVRSFRLPVNYRWALPDVSLDAKPQSNEMVLESLPEADATDKVWEDYLQTSTALIAGQLRDYGLYIPQGSVFVYDRNTGTLAVRTREAALQDLESFVSLELREVKRNLVFSLDVVEGKPDLIRSWLQETCTTRDHSSTWQQAEAGLKNGDVKLVHQMLLQTTSGSRVEGTCGIEQLHPSEIGLHGKELVQWYLKTHPAGFSLTLDAVLGPDDVTVDAIVELRVPLGQPRPRRELLSRLADGNEVSAPLLDLPLLKLQGLLTMQAGPPMLIGAWNSQRTGREKPESSMQTAFLRCDRQLALPSENKELARRMNSHAEVVSPTGKIANDRQRDGFGMETRAYRVPPTFLSAGEDVAVDATKVLESQGIQFPAGAKAVFRRNSSTLVVRNTPENLEMIELYVGGCTLWSGNRQVVFTLEVVEGPAETMRAMQQEAMGKVDHEDILKRLHQADESAGIRSLDFMRTVSRSGQLVKMQSGTERMYVESVESSALAFPSLKDTVQVAEGASPKPEPPDQSGVNETKVQNQIFPSTNTRMVGTLLELQPSISSDGVTVEVETVLEKHFASPSTLQERYDADSKKDQQATPSVRFHFARLPAVMSMNSGSTRLIGMWKPEGEGGYERSDVLQAAFLRVDLVQFVD